MLDIRFENWRGECSKAAHKTPSQAGAANPQQPHA